MEPCGRLVGNGEAIALISPTTEVVWFWSSAYRTDFGMNRGFLKQEGGSLALQEPKSANSLRIDSLKQRYVADTNVLQTECRLGNFVMRTVDFMPWKKPLLIRDITVVNEGENGAPFLYEFDWRNIDAERSEQQTMEGKTSVIKTQTTAMVCRSEGFIGYLEPGEERINRVVITYGKEESEACIARLNEAEAHVPQESIFFWEEWLDRKRAEAGALDSSAARLLLMTGLLFDEDGQPLLPPHTLATVMAQAGVRAE